MSAALQNGVCYAILVPVDPNRRPPGTYLNRVPGDPGLHGMVSVHQGQKTQPYYETTYLPLMVPPPRILTNAPGDVGYLLSIHFGLPQGGATNFRPEDFKTRDRRPAVCNSGLTDADMMPFLGCLPPIAESLSANQAWASGPLRRTSTKGYNALNAVLRFTASRRRLDNYSASISLCQVAPSLTPIAS